MKILSILILTLSIMSCSGDDCIPASESYTFYDGQLIIDTSFFFGFEIEDGDNLIFEYAHVGQDCLEIADDERTERILFQIESDSPTIDLSNEEVTSMYNVIALLPYSYEITTSTVKATKESNDKYDIEAKFTYQDRSGEVIEIEINEDFVRE